MHPSQEQLDHIAALMAGETPFSLLDPVGMGDDPMCPIGLNCAKRRGLSH